MQQFTGLNYLHIDIANQYGLDKESWNTRIQWTKDHINTLEDEITNASNSILYAKAVRALRDTQAGIPTGFIMGLDATASGYQIMAALTGCITTASNVNIGNNSTRQDLYTNITKQMHGVCGITIDREDCKDAMIPVAYGSKRAPARLFGDDTPELEAFWKIIYMELPGAMWLMETLQSFWNPYALAHSWTLPDKHVALVKVMCPVDKKIEIDELNHTTFTHRAYVNKPDSSGLSLAANIVHSIDGYIVREMIRRTNKKKIELLTIHDCFYSHPNNMQSIREFYVEILAEISKAKILDSILSEIAGSKVRINQDADISVDILSSEYALS